MRVMKKPIVVHTFRVDGIIIQPETHNYDFTSNLEPKPQWLKEAMLEGVIYVETLDDVNWVVKIKTLEGVMTCNIHDYIMRGVDGELYPCAKEIFEKTYDILEEV